MRERQVLCVADEPAGHDSLFNLLSSAGWQWHVVRTPSAALRATTARQFAVGLLMPGAAASPAPWEGVLRQRRDIEWVGIFHAQALEDPAWRGLILDHLFDHHTLPLDGERLRVTLGHALGRASIRPLPS